MRSSVRKRAISLRGILGRVVALGHLGDVGLRLLAVVSLDDVAFDRHRVLRLVDGKVGARIAHQVGRPAPAAPRVDDEMIAVTLIVAEQVPDHDLVRAAVRVDRRDRRVADGIGQEGTDVGLERVRLAESS